VDIIELKYEVTLFLRNNGMDHGDIDFENESNKFAKHMEEGLINKSDLKMIPSYIDIDGGFTYNEPVIAIDAGGTNFRRAVVTMKENEVLIENLEVFPMPGIKGEITKEEFFDCIVSYIEPILDRSNKIGFCFSYPVEILPNADGKVISLTKEVKVANIKNVELGKTLLTHIEKAGYSQKKKVIVLNDTTAVLLSGIGVSGKTKCDGYIGLILGTGTNTCYQEVNEDIKKNDKLVNKSGTTLINIESGGYSAASRGLIDEILDSKTSNPGEQQFEKMISGAYQGELVYETLKKAGEENVLTLKFLESITNSCRITSKNVSDFCNDRYSDDSIIGLKLNNHGTEVDRTKTFYLVDAIIERAAKLLAINCKAILIKMGSGRNPCKPVCLTIDGSTFYGSQSFRRKFDFYIKQNLENKGYYVKRIQVENGTLIGSTMAILIK